MSRTQQIIHLINYFIDSDFNLSVNMPLFQYYNNFIIELLCEIKMCI